MRAKPDTFAALLALWETPAELSQALTVPYVNAQSLKRRKSISPALWPAFIVIAKSKGVDLTLEDMAKMAVKRAGQVAA